MKIFGSHISYHHLKDLCVGAGVIGFSKGLIFFAPLLAGLLLADEDYAWIESLLATAQPLSLILTVGLGASFGVRAITENSSIFAFVASYHFKFLAFSSFFTALIFLCFSNDVLAIYFTGAAIGTLQFLGLIYRRKSRLLLTGLVDLTVYLPLILAVLSTWLFDNISFSFVFAVLVLLYLGLFVFLNDDSFLASNLTKPLLKDILQEYRIGVGFAIFSVLSMFVMTGSRFFISHLYSSNDLTVYARYFRVAAIMMVGNKVFTLVYFNNIYTETQESLSKKYLLIGLVSTIGIVVLFSLHKILHSINLLGNDKFLWLSILIQVKLWIDGALLEPLIQRSNRILEASISLSVVLGVYLISLYVFELSLRDFILGTIVMQMVCICVLAVLIKSSILLKHRKAIIIVPTFLIFLIYVITVR